MKTRWAACLSVSALILGLGSFAAADESGNVTYPDGYRSWTHVKSMVLFADHPLADPFEGIHHVYANEKAEEGLRGGGYPDGAVLVFDLLANKLGDAAVVEGERKFIGVMARDEARFEDTGGWGYEVFVGNSHTERGVADGGAACHACHMDVESSQYVFSSLRD